MAFGVDTPFRQKTIIDREKIKQRRRADAKANDAKENSKRLAHEYKIGDLVLIVMKDYDRRKARKISSPTEGPYKIVKVSRNGNVRIMRGAFKETMNIRRLKPYTAREQCSTNIYIYIYIYLYESDDFPLL